MYLLLTLALALVTLFLFGPREPAALQARALQDFSIDDLDLYLAQSEAGFDDITPGVEKQIIWAGEPGGKTALSVIYLHGFSATSQEIRPVPDDVAMGLGANLFLTRLAGHGRGGEAMAEPAVADWMGDLAEAVYIGRALGDEVIVISTSTGGTLAAAAALDPVLARSIRGIVFLSPNFRIKDPAAPVLTWPMARLWVPAIAGATREWEPLNEAQARYWSQSYPTTAVLPMAALVKAVRNLDFGDAKIPALFIFSDQDQIVDAAETRSIAGRWGAEASVETVEPGAGLDPFSHVLAGDIVSPARTVPTVARILSWARELPDAMQ